MNTKKLIAQGEFISVVAMVLVFFKVIVIQPECFNPLDASFTILPIFFVKIVEIMELFK